MSRENILQAVTTVPLLITDFNFIATIAVCPYDAARASSKMTLCQNRIENVSKHYTFVNIYLLYLLTGELL
jgi:hypothetical protein